MKRGKTFKNNNSNIEDIDSNYNSTKLRETLNFNTSINSKTKLNFSFRNSLKFTNSSIKFNGNDKINNNNSNIVIILLTIKIIKV